MSLSPPARPSRALPVFVSCLTVLVAPAASAQSPSTERIVIVANRAPQTQTSVLADISVIERDEIQRSGAFDLPDLLARLPGIAFVRNGGPGSVSSVFIRGSESRHTAVYLDGVRLDSQATGGAIWEQVPLDQIERIEVLRGPAAALYGSDAIGGVVQLFTRRGQGSARPTASLTLGSYNTARAQLGVSGSVDRLDYAVAATQGRSDGFDARTAVATGHNTDRDGWKRSSVQGRVGLQIQPSHRVEASLLASNLRAGYDGFAPGVDDQNHHALRSGSLSWQGRWNADATTRLQWGQTQSTFETQPSFYRTETTLRDLTLQHEQRIGTQVLTGTLERRGDELFNPATAFGAAFGGKRHQAGLGLGWRGNAGDHGFQAHVRHDEDSEFGGKSTGSLAWGLALTPQWRITASAATSFRVPTLFQRFSEYGNPSLTPESGRNLELGLRWAGAGGEASVTTWRNKVSNLINFGAPGPCLDAFGCYVNVGRATLEGVTLAGRTSIVGVALRASFDVHNPRNSDTNQLLPRRAKQFATVGAETQWNAPWGAWTLGTEVQASGARFENAANTQVMGGYGLLNLYASTRLTRDWSLDARLDNLGDKIYEQASAYAVAGRHAQLTLRWTMP